MKKVSNGCRTPWDIRYDDFSTIVIGGMVGHLKGLEAFLCLALRVPKIFDSVTTRNGNGASFTETTYALGETSYVEHKRVVENGLFENLCMGCRFGLC